MWNGNALLTIISIEIHSNNFAVFLQGQGININASGKLRHTALLYKETHFLSPD